MTDTPGSGDLMGGPEPDEAGTEVMGGAKSGGDVMGGPEPDEAGTDVMGGAELADECRTSVAGGLRFRRSVPPVVPSLT